VQLFHLTTNKQIASGHYGKNKVNKGSSVPVSIPVQFSYTAPNATDTTCEPDSRVLMLVNS
jgi:hypothetical protein